MKEFDYVPRSEKFVGVVKLKVPNYYERVKLVQTMQVGIKGGELTSEDQLGSVLKMLDIAKTHVVSIDLACEGMKLNSLEELSYFAEGTEMINELAGVVLSGIPLGKK